MNRPEIPLSQAARRAFDSPINDLMARALAAPDLVSLAAGFVDQASLPVEAAREAAASMLADPVDARRALQYGTTLGDPALRRRLVGLLETDATLEVPALADAFERTVVTNGSQQLLYLIAETLIDPGDIVLVESPTYFVFMGLLEAKGARVIGVETDDGGLRIDALESALEAIEARGELDRVKLIYTIPEHGNPTGLSLDADRRGALVAVARSWSKRRRIYILEDAAYRGLTYEGGEAPGVWEHDRAGDSVILARTFSKTFSPGLKLGWGLLPAPLVEPILRLKSGHDFGTSHFNQQLIEGVLARGDYTRQIDRLVNTYRTKRDAMLRALREHFAPWGGSVSWTHPRGGLYVWLTLPEGVDSGRDGRLFEAALAEGVLYVPGGFAFPREPVPPPTNTARLSFGVAPPARLDEGVRRLSKALASVAPPGRLDRERAVGMLSGASRH